MTKVYQTLTVIFCWIIFLGAPGSLLSQVLSVENGPAEIKPGYLVITAEEADSFYVVFNENFETVFHVASGDELAVFPGVYKVRIIKKYHLDFTFNQVIVENQTRHAPANMISFQDRMDSRLKTQSSYPRLFWGGRIMVLTDAETTLFVNDEEVGSGYAILNEDEEFILKGIHSSGNNFRRNISVGDGDKFLYIRQYNRPSRFSAYGLSFIPGASQLYKYQNKKAVVLTTAFSLTAGAGILYDFKYRKKNQKYTETRINYFDETIPQKAFELGNEVEVLFEQAQTLSTVRNSLLIGTAVIYLINVIDGFTEPALGFRGRKLRIDPYIDFQETLVEPRLRISKSF